jgi:hypothetical protein
MVVREWIDALARPRDCRKATVEPGGSGIGGEPFLHLGDVGVMVKRVGAGGGA